MTAICIWCDAEFEVPPGRKWQKCPLCAPRSAKNGKPLTPHTPLPHDNVVWTTKAPRVT